MTAAAIIRELYDAQRLESLSMRLAAARVYERAAAMCLERASKLRERAALAEQIGKGSV